MLEVMRDILQSRYLRSNVAHKQLARTSLRADVWNYGELGVSREISNSFIFCPSNLYSEVFSKITLKVSTAFYILRNWGKFENTVCWPPSNGEIGGK